MVRVFPFAPRNRSSIPWRGRLEDSSGSSGGGKDIYIYIDTHITYIYIYM